MLVLDLFRFSKLVILLRVVTIFIQCFKTRPIVVAHVSFSPRRLGACSRGAPETVRSCSMWSSSFGGWESSNCDVCSAASRNDDLIDVLA